MGGIYCTLVLTPTLIFQILKTIFELIVLDKLNISNLLCSNKKNPQKRCLRKKNRLSSLTTFFHIGTQVNSN